MKIFIGDGCQLHIEEHNLISNKNIYIQQVGEEMEHPDVLILI